MDRRLQDRLILNGLPAQARLIQSLATEAVERVAALGHSERPDALDELRELTGELHMKTRQLAGFFEIEPNPVPDRIRAEGQASAAPTVVRTPGQEISREPWWATPPHAGETENEVSWGYLITYDNGDVRFLNETPSPAEIRHRPGCPLRAATTAVAETNMTDPHTQGTRMSRRTDPGARNE